MKPQNFNLQVCQFILIYFSSFYLFPSLFHSFPIFYFTRVIVDFSPRNPVGKIRFPLFASFISAHSVASFCGGWEISYKSISSEEKSNHKKSFETKLCSWEQLTQTECFSNEISFKPKIHKNFFAINVTVKWVMSVTTEFPWNLSEDFIKKLCPNLNEEKAIKECR